MSDLSCRDLETFRGVAYPWHCDAMGHMNTQFYSGLYDGATLHFLSLLCSGGALKSAGQGWADVQQSIVYRHEVLQGDLLLVRSTLTRLGNSSIAYRHELTNAETDVVHSTSTQVTVLFDLTARKAVALTAMIRERALAMSETA